MTRLVEATSDDFDSFLRGEAPQGLRLSPDFDRAIAAHVRDIARRLRERGYEGSWMIVADDDVVGLCGFKNPPLDGVVEIGYNVCPSRQREGHASRAIAEILRHARADSTILSIVAETTDGNVASHRVLERNGFVRVGIRRDPDEGDLLLWQVDTDAPRP